MGERGDDRRVEIAPSHLHEKLGFRKGNEVGLLIVDLAPQVAMWRMARESGQTDGFFRTNSLEVSEYVANHYFNIRTRDVASTLLTLWVFSESPVLNFGIGFTLPDEGEIANEILRKERFYCKISYPIGGSDKYRFWPSFAPENIALISQTAEEFGPDTNLHILCTDAISFWEEETGLSYPVDSRTPDLVKERWDELWALESERIRQNQVEDLRRTWERVKDYFDRTKEAHRNGEKTDRISAVFDLMFTLQYGGFSFLPVQVTAIECQSDRDYEIFCACIEGAATWKDFETEMVRQIDARLEIEGPYRETINEVCVEVGFQGGETRVYQLLNEHGLLKTDTQEWIVYEQLLVVKAVLAVYNSLDVKDGETLKKGIDENPFLSTQIVEGIVEFLATNKPDYVSLQGPDPDF